MAGGALASLAILAAVVQVEGTTLCPPPELVALRLGDLLPADVVTDRPDRARLREEGDDLVILLERADGVLLATRRLPRTYGCDDLASAVAVLLAAWESDVHPEFAPHLAARTPRPLVSERSLPPLVPATQPWTVNAGVSLGLGASIDVPAVAGGGTIGAWVTPPGGRTSLRAEIEGQSERQLSVQDGRASWRRWTLGVGFERSFFAAAASAPPVEAIGGGRLRWFALARLAWLGLRGEGFALNHSDDSFDAGVTTGVRVVLGRGRWSSWIELAASFWPLRHDVVVSTSAASAASAASARLPAVEAFVRIGGGMASAR